MTPKPTHFESYCSRDILPPNVSVEPEGMEVGGSGKLVDRRRSIGTVAEMEVLLGDTIERVADLDERTVRIEEHVALLPDMKMLLTNVATTQTMIAQSGQDVAASLKKIGENEERQERLEKRYEAVVQTASGKKQVPQSLFVMLLAFFSIYVLVDKMKDTHINLNIPWLGIHITQEARGQNLP